MSSTAVPMQNMGNGYTIVTHVISQPTAPAGTESVVGLGPFKKFLKGEPKTLGYLIAGSLTVAAINKHNRCLVNGSLVLNVFSTISAGIAIILLSLDLAFGPLYYSCYEDDEDYCYIADEIVGPQTISSTLMNCPPVESPPPYSEMKGQPVN